jgi:hypothetical protein
MAYIMIPKQLESQHIAAALGNLLDQIDVKPVVEKILQAIDAVSTKQASVYKGALESANRYQADTTLNNGINSTQKIAAEVRDELNDSNQNLIRNAPESANRFKPASPTASASSHK